MHLNYEIEDIISLADDLVLVSLCPCFIKRTHYPALEKPGAQNIAVCEKQSNH